jgi:hypothetical protein
MIVASWGACALLLASLACCTLWDVDYWWQLATGDWIREHGMMRVEQFTQGHAGTPRIESSWLYCVAISAIEDVAGVPGLVVLKGVLWAMAFAAVAWAKARERSSPGANLLAPALVAVAVVASSLRFGVRPEAVSAAILAVNLLALERHRVASRWWLLVPPLLQALWVNVHSYWVLGPLCVAAYAACDARRDGRGGAWIACLAGCAAACLCNPYGVDMLTLPLHQFGVMTASGSTWLTVAIVVAGYAALWAARRRGSEAAWRSSLRRVAPVLLAAGLGVLWIEPVGRAVVGSLLPTPSPSGERGSITELASAFAVSSQVPSIVWFKALASLALACAVMAPARRDRPLAVITAAGFVLTAISVRNLPLFCIPAAAWVSVAVGRLVLAMPTGRWRSGVATIPAAVAMLTMLSVTLQAATNRFWLRQGVPCRAGLGVEPFQFADGACGFLATIGFDGRLFNSHAQGGRLIAAGLRVFIDPRAVRGSMAEYVEWVRDPVLSAPRMAERFDVCVIDAAEASMASQLMLRGWRVCFVDPAAVVMARPGYREDVPAIDPADPALLADIRERIGPVVPFATAKPWTRLSSPHPSLRMARVLEALGHREQAAPFRDAAISAVPPRLADRWR